MGLGLFRCRGCTAAQQDQVPIELDLVWVAHKRRKSILMFLHRILVGRVDTRQGAKPVHLGNRISHHRVDCTIFDYIEISLGPIMQVQCFGRPVG